MGEYKARLEQRVADQYKSEGERQIAGFLEHYQMKYEYEVPLAVIDRGKVRIWYPDFHLPEYRVFIEYAGVENDNGYATQIEHKRGVYAEMGLPVIFMGPGSFSGLWPEKILRNIEGILEERLQRFRLQTGQGFGRGARALEKWTELHGGSGR